MIKRKLFVMVDCHTPLDKIDERHSVIILSEFEGSDIPVQDFLHILASASRSIHDDCCCKLRHKPSQVFDDCGELLNHVD